MTTPTTAKPTTRTTSAKAKAQTAPAPAPADVTTAKATAAKARDVAKTAREAAAKAAKDAKEAAAKAKEAAASAPKAKTAREYVREIDAAILEAAGEIAARIAVTCPDIEMRADILAAVSNQLHHLTTPKVGWVGSLPTPERSEWK